jgi:lipoprotein signal peptidase
MNRFATLELDAYPRRATLMAAAAAIALLIDLVSKHVAVALEPSTLLFSVSSRTPFGLESGVIFVAAASSLVACIVPARIVVVGAGVALGGALANLTSRHVWRMEGGTPDFIRFGDGSTGNVADLFIASGVAAMVFGASGWLAWTAFRGRHR